jgi:nucleoside-diphosphate-sugar epimerase
MTDHLESERIADTTPPATMLVTGATGFLGARLVQRLLSNGQRVRVLVRSSTRGPRLADRSAEVFLGDIADREALRTAADGATVIYHLAGRLLVPGVSAEEYHRTHVEGTNALVSVCRGVPSVRRFVHVSTTGVLGSTGDRAAAEEAPIRPTNVYEDTKAQAESIVRESWRDGFPAVIARPGLVYGPGDLHLLPFFHSVLHRRFRPIGSRPIWLHPIYVDDLIQALLLCGRHPSALGECFHLAGREPVSLADLADAVARAGGTRLPAGHIPLLAARAVARLGDQLPAVLKRWAPLTTSRLDFLTHSRVYDTAKARRLLGFTAATELAAGAAQTVAWYRRQGYLPAVTGVSIS